MTFNNTFIFLTETASPIYMAIATLAMPIITSLALVIAYIQIRSSRKSSQENNAHQAYDNYLALCLLYPDFAYPNPKKIKQRTKKYNQYKWFLSKVLYTFEQIIIAMPDNEHWKIAIASQLKRHKWHLEKSKMIKRKEWDSRLICIISNL